MANKRQYEDLRLMSKRANQRFVEMEKQGIKSPAYQAAQAKLEMLGRRSGDGRGRRFSETGKATYNEYEAMKKILSEFLEAETGTISGAKGVINRIYETTDEKYGLSELGISKDEYLEFISNWSDKNKDKLLSSEQAIEIYRSYTMKSNKMNVDGRLTPQEIAQIIKESSNVKEAYKAVGITYKDIKAVRELD